MRKFAWIFLFLVGCVSAPPKPVATAGMDKEKIRAVIRDHIVPIRHCYEKELKVTPRLAGKLVLEWDIAELGKVTEVRVIKSVNKKVDECVSEVVRGCLFETPPENQIGRVSFPFVFSPDPAKTIN